MSGTIGNIAGGPLDGSAGSTLVGAADGEGNGAEAKAFEQVLSGFALQVVQDAMGEMDEAMQDTEEEFE